MTPPSLYCVPNSAVQLLAPAPELDFHCTHRLELPQEYTALEIWNLMRREPLPLMKQAFQIRDAISSRFGVKRIGGFSTTPVETVQQGEMLDFFLVEHISDSTLSLSARDRHLDVLTCISIENQVLSITSSVVTHNLFGRIYMVPVGPAHRLIVAVMLRRLRKTLSTV